MKQAVTARLAVRSVLKSRTLENIFYHLEKFFSWICVITALWSGGSVAVSGSYPVLFHISQSFYQNSCWISRRVSSLLCTMSALVTSQKWHIWFDGHSAVQLKQRVRSLSQKFLLFVSFSCFCLIFSVYSLVNVTFLPVNQARWSVNQCICMNADTACGNHGSKWCGGPEELHSLTTIRGFFESQETSAKLETSNRQRDTMGRGQTVLSVCWRFSPAAASRCSRTRVILVLCK